jgi:hypothetical protein
LHEHGLEPDDVPGDAQPEKMAVDPFQLEQGGPDIPRPLRNLNSCCLFDGLTVTRTVNKPSYPADPFRQKDHLVVGEDAVGQLLDPPVVIEAAIITAHDLFPLNKNPEISRLFEDRIERTDRDNTRLGWRRI